ncbi:MAG: hypothetical protein VB050_07475 [Geobacteraceae bacterium]|nr:hypothetical protein [Geobacteraceae bacterium]
MNTTGKYLDALEAAVDANDREAITLLEAFATDLYHKIHTQTEAASGGEREAWERMLQRVKRIISGMVKHGPDLW